MALTAFCLKHSQDKGLKKGKVISTVESVGSKEGEDRHAEAGSREWPRRRAVGMKLLIGAALKQEQQMSHTRDAGTPLHLYPPLSGGHNPFLIAHLPRVRLPAHPPVLRPPLLPSQLTQQRGPGRASP